MKTVCKQVVVVLSVILLSAPTVFSQSLPKNVGEIGENIYSYSLDGEYFSMFIVTEDGVIAIESINSMHAKGMVDAIKQITEKPIKYLLHSHNHWDHASGGQVFKDAGAKTVAHVEAYEWMKANTGRDMVVPDEFWGGNRKDITLGKTTVELRYLGMNHGLGMTIFLVPEQKIAFIADLVTPHRVLFNIVPDFNIKEWERSLEEIIKIDFEKAIYSHNHNSNPLKGGTKQDAIDNLQLIRDIREGLYSEMKKGTNPMTLPSTMKLPKYQDWAMYDEWLPMNIWRILLDEFMGPFPWRPDHEDQKE